MKSRNSRKNGKKKRKTNDHNNHRSRDKKRIVEDRRPIANGGKEKVNYNEAIKYLLSLVQAKKKDQEKFLKACTPDTGVDPKQLVQDLLHERRKDEREDA